MSDYFSKTEYVSNSMLGWLERSPAYFLQKLSYNAEEKENKSLEYGKLLHYYFEDPSQFIVADFEKPTGKAGEFLDAYHISGDMEKAKAKVDHGWSVKVLEDKVLKSNDGKKYLDFLKQSEGRLALTRDQKYKLEGAIKSLNSNPLITPFLHTNLESYNELEIYWEETPYLNGTQYEVKTRGKLDKVILDHDNKKIQIFDLKSTSGTPYGNLFTVNSLSDPQIDFKGTGWFYSFLTYRYYRQAAMYYKAVHSHFAELIQNDYKVEFYFIVAELGGAFDTAVYKVSDNLLGYGLREMHDLIEDYAYYKETNDWTMPRAFKKIRTV